MATAYGMYQRANQLVRECGTRDPEQIAEDIGIWVYDAEELRNLLGMYTVKWNHRVILMNPNIGDNWRCLVMAHEVGHDQLHRPYAKDEALQEFVLYNLKNSMEYEANAFASHILLDNDDVYALAKQGYDVFQMSKMLNTHMNLMLVKLTEMMRLGYDLRLPCNPDGRFLRKIKGCDAE